MFSFGPGPGPTSKPTDEAPKRAASVGPNRVSTATEQGAGVSDTVDVVRRLIESHLAHLGAEAKRPKGALDHTSR